MKEDMLSVLTIVLLSLILDTHSYIIPNDDIPFVNYTGLKIRDIRRSSIVRNDEAPHHAIIDCFPPGGWGIPSTPGTPGPRRGFRGPRGLPGMRGPRGLRGPMGPKGDSLYVVPDGSAYPAGLYYLHPQPGDPGLPGLAGLPGMMGDPGDIGIVGRPGSPGPKGEPCTDPCLYTGPYTTVDDESKMGLPGINGAPGIPGLTGLPGLDGIRGSDGLPGLMGLQGEPGRDTDTDLGQLPIFETVESMQRHNDVLSITDGEVADLAFVMEDDAIYIRTYHNGWKKLALVQQ